jgi:SNF2 family DNA or RNA helicase
MVKIEVKDNELRISDPTDELFEWNHRSFFNLSLSLEIKSESNCYISNSNKKFPGLIRDILDYLNEEKIIYEIDETVKHYIDNYKKQDSEFKQITKEISENHSPIDFNLSEFKRELKDYQEKAVEHLLLLKHGANFSVPGSGKTTVVYAYFDKLRQDGIVDKIFVVGPLSSFSPWEEESVECFNIKLKAARLVGNKRNYIYDRSDEYDLFLCHYQTVAKDVNEIIKLCKKHSILFVIDESHYIKRFFGGIWAESLLTISPFAKRRVILSGTPMPNGYIDLWSQFTFLWPGLQLLGERNAYKKQIDNVNKLDDIKAKIRPFFYRVKKDDLNLPGQNIIKRTYSLNPVQAQIYHALSIKLLKDLQLEPSERQSLKIWRKAKMVRLLQAASNPTLLAKYSEEFKVPPLSSDGSSVIQLINKYSQYEIPAKFEVAIALIKELITKGEKVLIWTTFIHNITMLQSLLDNIPHYIIHGQIPRDDSEDFDYNREKNIASFKNSTVPCLLIANPAACAESISLHKASTNAIYLDRTFNCGQYIQSLDRIHRIGSIKEVNYYILLANDTIDITIDRRLDEKFETMKSVLEDELPIGSLDVDEFEMELNENEEEQDFSATIFDIQKNLN